MHAMVIMVVLRFLYSPRVFASSVHLLVMLRLGILPLGILLFDQHDWTLETQ